MQLESKPNPNPGEKMVKNWLRALFPAPPCHLCKGVNDRLPMKCTCSYCDKRLSMIVVEDKSHA